MVKETSKLSKAELLVLVQQRDAELAEKAASLTAAEAKQAQLRGTLVRTA